ncbi:hypothetical protein MOQ_004027 [Trypanosoma cruzi marinkellei]|uniref:Uncharacterized protein n=1 Tax=Trypanosoma cruzi marinkellei TaxID=85056 RepID=K2MAI2_TRYCR|nr:hypothetical protein MOQ_004027 [Trypanosoma cruzi marinkellei]
MASSGQPFAPAASAKPSHRTTLGLWRCILTPHSRTASSKKDVTPPPQNSGEAATADDVTAGSATGGYWSLGLGKTCSPGVLHQKPARGTNLFTRIKNILVPSHESRAQRHESDVRHEPYSDVSFEEIAEGNLNGDANDQTGPVDVEAVGRAGVEECYYYTTEDGEVYYVDPVSIEYQGAYQQQEAEEEKDGAVENNKENQQHHHQLQQQQQGEEEHSEHRQGEEEEEEEEGGGHEEHSKGPLRLRGKMAKTLASEETKRRRQLQEDCMIVLTDIGRVYRGLARSVAAFAKEMEALRHAIKQLEKEAVKQAKAVEAEWKKEHVELSRTFRVEMELAKRRHERRADPTLFA